MVGAALVHSIQNDAIPINIGECKPLVLKARVKAEIQKICNAKTNDPALRIFLKLYCKHKDGIPLTYDEIAEQRSLKKLLTTEDPKRWMAWTRNNIIKSIANALNDEPAAVGGALDSIRWPGQRITQKEERQVVREDISLLMRQILSGERAPPEGMYSHRLAALRAHYLEGLEAGEAAAKTNVSFVTHKRHRRDAEIVLATWLDEYYVPIERIREALCSVRAETMRSSGLQNTPRTAGLTRKSFLDHADVIDLDNMGLTSDCIEYLIHGRTFSELAFKNGKNEQFTRNQIHAELKGVSATLKSQGLPDSLERVREQSVRARIAQWKRSIATFVKDLPDEMSVGPTIMLDITRDKFTKALLESEGFCISDTRVSYITLKVEFKNNIGIVVHAVDPYNGCQGSWIVRDETGTELVPAKDATWRRSSSSRTIRSGAFVARFQGQGPVPLEPFAQSLEVKQRRKGNGTVPMVNVINGDSLEHGTNLVTAELPMSFQGNRVFPYFAPVINGQSALLLLDKPASDSTAQPLARVMLESKGPLAGIYSDVMLPPVEGHRISDNKLATTLGRYLEGIRPFPPLLPSFTPIIRNGKAIIRIGPYELSFDKTYAKEGIQLSLLKEGDKLMARIGGKLTSMEWEKF